MAGNELKIHGLEEFKANLRKLPAELVGEADGIVRGAASALLEDVLATYPTTGTGNLARGLSLEAHSDTVSARAGVRNRARHAWLYEHGSKERQWAKGSNTAPFRKKGSRPVPTWGAGRSTGTMPAADRFRGLAVAHRRAMNVALKALLERAGFTVTGSAD